MLKIAKNIYHNKNYYLFDLSIYKYKLGSIILEHKDSEEIFQLIRESTYTGSICGMMKYDCMIYLDQNNEFEAIDIS